MDVRSGYANRLKLVVKGPVETVRRQRHAAARHDDRAPDPQRNAPQAEWSGPDWECTPTGLSGPNPTNLSKVRELLEAASSAQ
jgi:hypothetical protein